MNAKLAYAVAAALGVTSFEARAATATSTSDAGAEALEEIIVTAQHYAGQ